MAILDLFKNLFSSDNAESLVRNNVGLLLNENPFARDITNIRSVGASSSSDPNQKIPNSQSGQNLDVQQFPADLGSIYINFGFSKYVRPNPNDNATIDTVFSVSLPLPRVLTEQHTMNLTPQALKTIDVITGGVESMTSGQGMIRQLSDPLGGIIDAAGTVSDIAFSAASQYFMDSGAQLGFFPGEQVFGRLQQSLGFIPNPHLSIFFNGVDLRPAIEFSWLFTPRTPDESNSLKQILKKIKSKILPEVSSGNANIMNYPHIVQPTIVGVDADMIPKYKRGLISAVSINYTPNGPSFFKGTNSPTFIAFSFLFQEIEIFTAQDYDGNQAKDLTDRLSGVLSNALGEATQALQTAQQIQNAIRTTGFGL